MTRFNKCLLVLVFVLGISSVAYAGGSFNGSLRQIFNNVSIGATGSTVTSVSIPVPAGRNYGVWYQATITNSGGQTNQAPNLSIDYLMSYADTPITIFAKPLNSDIDRLVIATTPQTVGITPPTMGYLKIRAQGNSGSSPSTNSSTTTLNMYLFTQE